MSYRKSRCKTTPSARSALPGTPVTHPSFFFKKQNKAVDNYVKQKTDWYYYSFP